MFRVSSSLASNDFVYILTTHFAIKRNQDGNWILLRAKVSIAPLTCKQRRWFVITDMNFQAAMLRHFSRCWLLAEGEQRACGPELASHCTLIGGELSFYRLTAFEEIEDISGSLQPAYSFSEQRNRRIFSKKKERKAFFGIMPVFFRSRFSAFI